MIAVAEGRTWFSGIDYNRIKDVAGTVGYGYNHGFTYCTEHTQTAENQDSVKKGVLKFFLKLVFRHTVKFTFKYVLSLGSKGT